MKVQSPQAVNISTHNVWRERSTVKGIFLRRHNLEENLYIVEKEVNDKAIILNPKKWLLLVEGRSKYRTVENLYLDGLIEQNHLFSSDPVVPPFTKQIAEASSVDKDSAALSVLIAEYLDFIDSSDQQIIDEGVRDFLDKSVSLIAGSFQLRTCELQNRFIGLKWNTPFFWLQVEQLQEIKQKLIDESNCQSRIGLISILQKYKHPNVLVMSGIAHKSVFEETA